MDGPYEERRQDGLTPNDLDAHALGLSAPRKGLARAACPYAEGTQARERWLAGYDAAVAGGAEPVTGGIAKEANKGQTQGPAGEPAR